MHKRLIYSVYFALVSSFFSISTADAELVGYWKFDEGSGTAVIDDTGHNSSGTLQGDPTWSTGISGRAIEFDGDGDYITIPNSEEMQLRSSGQYTVAIWVMVQNTEGGIIMMVGQGCSSWASWFLGVGGGEPDAPRHEGNLVFGVRSANSTGYASLTAPLVQNTWTHITATYDGNILRLYQDGEETGNTDAPLPYANFDPFNIGGDPGCDGRQWFEGAIDDLKIYDEGLSQKDVLGAMRTDTTQSFNPHPKDGAPDIQRDTALSWTPGENIDSHDVYLGTVFNDVNEASRTNPLGVLISQGQDANTYDPYRFELGQTYYWRVDEVGSTITKGDIWSFTAEPVSYPIAGENITATASSSDTSKGPENTVNGSGLDESGLLHNIVGTDGMWLSSPAGEQPSWIEYDLNKVCKLHKMWVWNSNENLEPVIGLGIKEATIEYSVDGIEYMTLGTTHEFARAPGLPDYEHNTEIDFGDIPVKYVRITANSNWGGLLNQFGLSEVRFFSIPVDAVKPSPELGATDVPLDATLNWRAGREAVSHNIYFSDDMQAVADGTAPVVTVNTASRNFLNLDLGTMYYWRVDEVNEARSPDIWEGNIWSFTTQEYLVFDDFEDYNDYEPYTIYLAWTDGYNDSGNGATVGYPDPEFAYDEHFVETEIVHGGKQSMPYFYENTVAPKSEITMTLSLMNDWTSRNIGVLSLWYIGSEGNAAEPMYVTLNESATVTNEDANAAQVTEWTQWTIDLQVFADQGADLTNVTTITIGFGDNPPGGSGLVFFDDIRLYVPPE